MDLRFSLRAALFLSIVFLNVPSSEASPACSKTCGSQVRECVADSRPSKQQCREECRSNALRREVDACEAGCRSMQRMTKKTCRTGRAGCTTACDSGVDVSIP